MNKYFKTYDKTCEYTDTLVFYIIIGYACIAYYPKTIMVHWACTFILSSTKMAQQNREVKVCPIISKIHVTIAVEW